MHLKVVIDTVGITIVLHEHEREASGEDGIQVTRTGTCPPRRGATLPPGVVTVMSTKVPAVPAGLTAVITPGESTV